MIQRHTYGYFYGILSAALYASVSIVAKHLITGGAHPFVILFYQYVFTVAILGIWHLIRNPRALRCDMKKIGYFAILGVAGGGATNLLFYSSLGYLDAGIGSMLLFLHPVFITVFFAVSKIKAMKPINFFCTLMAAFGAAIVLNVFSGSLSFPVAGVALGLLGAITYAFYNIFADLKLKEEDPNVINFYAGAAAMLFSAVVAAGSGVGFQINPASLPSLIFLSVFSGVIPSYCFLTALKYIGSEKVSVIASLELPLTLIMAFTILKEHMEPVQLLGVALIVFATILLHRTESAKTPEDAKDENHESPSDPKAAGKPE
ncbi:MAG TPA: DMT family transporter [Bacillota bacterium]|nr:DMT family transporter [Bacillota bacterium]